MQVEAYKIRALNPPQDDLLAAITEIPLHITEGDVVAVSSKVVSIHEGRCVPTNGPLSKDELVKREADLYIAHKKVQSFTTFFTITRGVLIGRAGIDESNSNDHYVLYPYDPEASAQRLLKWFKKTYNVQKLGLIITDSHSTPLRRGAIGFALGHAGFNPLQDYRGTNDIFGRPFKAEQANIADSLAVAAVLCMGEGAQQTPIAVIRGAPVNWNIKISKRPWSTYSVTLDDDKFSPFLRRFIWKKGGGGKK